jgi:hypothetical protein
VQADAILEDAAWKFTAGANRRGPLVSRQGLCTEDVGNPNDSTVSNAATKVIIDPNYHFRMNDQASCKYFFWRKTSIEALSVREFIVNLNGGEVSSICYNTSVSNDCSSFAVGSIAILTDLIWLAAPMYRRGKPW